METSIILHFLYNPLDVMMYQTLIFASSSSVMWKSFLPGIPAYGCDSFLRDTLKYSHFSNISDL